MENLSLEKENIIKDIKNFIRLRKEQNYTAVKGIGNPFTQEKQTKKLKIEY